MIHQNDKKAYLKEQFEFINKYPVDVGSKIFELEEEFKKYFRVGYASACSSGSTGLWLALKALGICPGDEVMMNCNYFVSDPNAVSLLGAKPIFIDLGDSINSLSLDDIKNKITQKTKAIIIIHLYGYPLENTAEIVDFCKERNIVVIEDCCQSIGARIGEDFVGVFGDLGVFSFDTNKMVKGGEGGMIISNDKKIIEKTKLFKNNCKRDGNYIDLGFNYRYNDFSAIYAKYSLKNLGNTIDERTELSKGYGGALYSGGEGISSSYYRLILKNSQEVHFENHDFYHINYDDFPNFKRHFNNYEII